MGLDSLPKKSWICLCMLDSTYNEFGFYFLGRCSVSWAKWGSVKVKWVLLTLKKRIERWGMSMVYKVPKSS